MKRTNLSVDSDTFERFSRQAKEQNKTIAAFGNESLEFVSSVFEAGGDLKELAKLWRAYGVIRQVDVLTLPSDFVDDLNERLCQLDREWTLRSFFEQGRRISELLKMVSPDLESLESVANDFFILLPVKHFKLTKMETGVRVDLAGVGRKAESAECTFEFVRGVLEGYDYYVTNKELGVGIVRIWASRRGAFP